MTGNRTQTEQILEFSQARTCVEEHARKIAPPVAETVPLKNAAGRVLAEELRADREYPPFDRAARDGYALRVSDIRAVPVKLRVIGSVRAGELWPTSATSVAAGECAEIMTGAPLPPGADAVVMVEDTSPAGEKEVAVKRS